LTITRERKEELLAAYTEMLSGSTGGIIITENRGMTVAQVADLRNRLRQSTDARFVVTKNTLLRIALENSGWAVPLDMLQGATAVAFANGNVPGVMKVLQGFVKDNPEKLAIRGGILEMQTVFGEKDIDAVASMPTMEEIRAQLAGLIVQPAAQLAGLLNSATAQVVNVIQAYLDKQNEGAAA
jgi:large subunit ribosomal protein L10